MLLNACALLALMSTLVLALLGSELDVARTVTQRAAIAALQNGRDRAVAAVLAEARIAMRAGTAPSPMPAVAPIAGACADARCTMTARAAVAWVDAPANDCGTGDACVSALQTNPLAAEGRALARITVTVAAPDGTALAKRAYDLALRLLPVAPYVAVTGLREDSFDGLGAQASSGDDGGIPAPLPRPCATASAESAQTDVAVTYRNAGTGACTDGSAFGSGAYAVTAPNATGWNP